MLTHCFCLLFALVSLFFPSDAPAQHHPDKGGDEEQFKKITTAFEVLSDEEKKSIYDEYGEEGLKDGGASASNPHDIFDAVFGGSLFRGNARGPRKGEDVVHSLKVTLEDLYNGKTSKLAIVRNRVCGSCKGSGASKPDAVRPCGACDGSGIRVMLNQIGPGMVQQVQTRCTVCSGQGETISDRHKCHTCGGNKVTKERKVLEVYVDKGMSHGQKLVFPGEANENPGLMAGDVVVILKQAEHEFVRKGNNLVIEREISLTDALCGFQLAIKQLDGRILVVNSPQGLVINPGDVKSIPNEGMPTWKHPDERGYMFVTFKVRFPTSVQSEDAGALEQILGPRTRLNVSMHAEEVEEVPLLKYQEAHARQRETADFDDDEEDGPRHVQCANQ